MTTHKCLAVILGSQKNVHIIIIIIKTSNVCLKNQEVLINQQ